MSSFYEYSFLSKMEKPYQYILEPMNQMRDVAVQASMKAFVNTEAMNFEDLTKQTNFLKKAATIICRIVQTWPILSTHWRDIQKYPTLREFFIGLPETVEWLNALKKNNNQYSRLDDEKAILDQMLINFEQGLKIGLQSADIKSVDALFEFIGKHIMNYLNAHNIHFPNLIENFFNKLQKPHYTPEVMLVSPDVVYQILPFVDLFYITAAQLVYIAKAYETLYIKAITENKLDRYYLWLGTLRFHLTDGIMDYIIDERVTKRQVRQRFRLKIQDILDYIKQNNLLFFKEDLSLYIDHEGVKTNMVKNVLKCPESNLLGLQPKLTYHHFNFWGEGGDWSCTADHWHLQHKNGEYYYAPYVHCTKIWGGEMKIVLVFEFKWEHKKKVIDYIDFKTRYFSGQTYEIEYYTLNTENNTEEWKLYATQTKSMQHIQTAMELPETQGTRIMIKTVKSNDSQQQIVCNKITVYYAEPYNAKT